MKASTTRLVIVTVPFVSWAPMVRGLILFGWWWWSTQLTTTGVFGNELPQQPPPPDHEDILLPQLSKKTKNTPALARARQLQPPLALTAIGGEHEDAAFWERNHELLQAAWQEWITTTNSGVHLLPLHEEALLINASLMVAVHDAWQNPNEASEQRILDIATQVAPGVYQIHLLTEVGVTAVRQHLQYAVEESGIPCRRPNGMNRYGYILDDQVPGGVAYPPLVQFYRLLADQYLRPMGRLLFPKYLGTPSDDSESYAFTIQYRRGQDVQLREHSDASAVTMNVQLNLPHELFSGSSLLFRAPPSTSSPSWQSAASSPSHGAKECAGEDLPRWEQRSAHSCSWQSGKEGDAFIVSWSQAGQALIHRGLQRHAALPIDSGDRHNMVIWLFGPHGYVRTAPYLQHERMSITERWQQREARSMLEHNELMEFEW